MTKVDKGIRTFEKLSKRNSFKERFDGAYLKDGKFTICDGYRAYVLAEGEAPSNAHVGTDNTIPSDVVADILRDASNGRISIDADIFNGIGDMIKELKDVRKQVKETKIRTYNTNNPNFRIVISESKAFGVLIFDVNGESMGVNIEYIKDTDDIVSIQDCDILVSGIRKPVYFRNKTNGRQAIVLPVIV